MEENNFIIARHIEKLRLNHNMVAAVIDAAGILFIQFEIFEIFQLIELEKHQTRLTTLFLV